MLTLERARARSRPLVEPLAQLFAGLEEGDVLFADLDALAGARIAAQPRAAALDREGAKAAELDPVAPRQRRRDLVEHGGNDAFDVTLVEVRIALSQALDELGFRHGAALAPCRVNILKILPNPAPGVKDSEGRQPVALVTRLPSRPRPCRCPCG